jgi:hypothetical protein
VGRQDIVGAAGADDDDGPAVRLHRGPRGTVAAPDDRAFVGDPRPDPRRIALVKTARVEETSVEFLAQVCPHLPLAQVRARFVATMGILDSHAAPRA